MIFHFNLSKGLIIVPVKIYGIKGDTICHMALDTGATKTLINWEITNLLGYDPAIAKERIKVFTASGIEFSPLLKITKIQSLSLIQENFPVLCHTLPSGTTVDGLLGLDFFKNTILTIDFKKGKLITK